jgi:hypothetical protein
MKHLTMLLIMAATALAAGCTQEANNHKTISWYIEHPNERGAKLKWCKDDAARMASPDCLNAIAAEQKTATDNYKSQM